MGKTETVWKHLFLPHSHLTDVFTPEDFSKEDQLIAKTIDMFVKQKITPKLSLIEQHHYQVVCELFKKAGELGLLAIEVPEAYDGLELSKTTAGLVAEKMGWAASFSVSFNIHVGVGTLPYVYFGTEKQKEKYLPKLAAGEWIGAYALTEPGAGSDALRSKTKAVLNKEKTAWILNGEKQWITNAHVADVYVVFAKTPIGMTAFIVERTYHGVTVGPEEKKMGIKGSSTATVILENVAVPIENVLGEVGKGHRIALSILNMARLKLAISNVGTAKQALELAVRYGKERKQFGQPIFNFTMMQEKIADMAIAIYGAESAAYRTSGIVDESILDKGNHQEITENLSIYALECAMNKFHCSEVLHFCADEAVQIHGGYGFMQEYEVERLYRDVRINRIFEGTNEINRLTVAKNIWKRFRKQEIHMEDIKREIGLGNRNQQYLHLSKWLFLQTLQILSASPVYEEQEYSRLLANMAKDMLVMESVLLRTEKAVEQNGAEAEKIKQFLTDILCEEGYRQVEIAAITIIASAENDEGKRNVLLEEIRQAPVPIYSNLFIKKREIAKEIGEKLKYSV